MFLAPKKSSWYEDSTLQVNAGAFIVISLAIRGLALYMAEEDN
jgi:hypothetical protein